MDSACQIQELIFLGLRNTGETWVSSVEHLEPCQDCSIGGCQEDWGWGYLEDGY